MECLGNHPATTQVPMPQGKSNYINMDSFLPASEGKTWQKLQKQGLQRFLHANLSWSGQPWCSLGPFHLKGSGCCQVPTRAGAPCSAWAQPDTAGYLPGTRSPRHWRGDVCTKAFPAHAVLTPLPCCVPEPCDSSTGTEELQSCCHQCHPSSAVVATASKPKPTTNIAMDLTDSMGAARSERGCSHPSLT